MSKWEGRERELPGHIVDYMNMNDLTQKDLAERMGVSPVTINRILNGSGNLYTETLYKLADALSAHPMEFIIGRDDGLILSLFLDLRQEYKDAIKTIILALHGHEMGIEERRRLSRLEAEKREARVKELQEEINRLQGELKDLTHPF